MTPGPYGSWDFDVIQDGGYKRAVPRDENPTLVPREALEDALEGLWEIIDYVPMYFTEKWGLEEYLERAQRVLNE